MIMQALVQRLADSKREVRNETVECVMELTEVVGADSVIGLLEDVSAFSHRSHFVRRHAVGIFMLCVKLYGAERYDTFFATRVHTVG